jgi:WD40 repeat protein
VGDDWDDVLDAAAGTLQGRLRGKKPLVQLSFTTDGARLVGVEPADREAWIWDVAAALKGGLPTQSAAPPEGVGRPTLRPTRMVFVEGWRHAHGAETGPYNDTDAGPAASPDGRWFLAFSERRLPRLIDAATWSSPPDLIGDGASTLAAAFAADGRTLATAHDDGTVRLWNVATRVEMMSLRTPGAKSARWLAFAPRGRKLAAAGPGWVRLWSGTPSEEIDRRAAAG